jgi:putative pyruvate formate lyase activating enzyme
VVILGVLYLGYWLFYLDLPFQFIIRENNIEMNDQAPGYLALFRSGELERRSAALEARLAACDICPWRCGVNRLKNEQGFCRTGSRPIVSSFCAHHGEEPAVSGTRGSGTIFFGNCNMRCVYCQNFQISQDPDNQRNKEIDSLTLAAKLLYLQDKLKCHNINLVSPTHFVPQILSALVEAVPRGLRLPLVYNTGGYDSLETIKTLDGIVDIYLPDIRYASTEIGQRYSKIPDYVPHNRAAIQEMYRQVGDLKTDENEIAYRGVIIRHLILPERLAGSDESLTWLAEEVSRSVTLSVMSQYCPCHFAKQIPPLDRTITYREYSEVVNLMEKLGLENGWLQEMEAPTNYLPDFSRENPFSETT